MEVEHVLRRIESQCRKDITAYTGYAPRRQDGTGPLMKGAQSEARGVVDCCNDVRALCRKLRREHRISKAALTGGDVRTVEVALFAVGDEVRLLPGASAWMRAHNYWINDWPESIDGMAGTILHDYTRYAGNDCHFEVEIEGVNGCGVHPQWLTANNMLTVSGERNGGSKQ